MKYSRGLGIVIAISLILGGTLLISKKDGQKVKKKVYFDMDGNMDDAVAFLLLINFDNIDLVGVTITPADCYLEPAKELVSKILHKKGLKVPIASSNIEGIHPFPDSFKDLTVKSLVLPSLITTEYSHENEVNIEASEHMYNIAKEIFTKTNEKITFLITGPPSTLVKSMEVHPDIKDFIEEVIWMGGAIEVDGNVPDSPTSEFNAYWDPPNLKKFIESDLPIKIISLDSTNSVPVDKNMLNRLAKNRRYEVSNLASEFFSLAYFIDPDGRDTYYAWDCLAAMATGFEDLLSYKEVEVEVIDNKANQGQNEEGRIKIKNGSNHYIEFAQKLDSKRLQQFYDLFIQTLKHDF